MSFKARISRLAFAVGVAGLISAQIPASGGVAMADDGYNLGGGNSARVPIEIAVIGLVGYGIVSTFSSGGAAAAGTAADAIGGGGGGGVPIAGITNSNNGPADIYDIAKGNPDLSSFANDADKAGLKDTLSDTGAYTVFAPTSAAFAALSPATMANLNDPNNKAMLTQLMQTHIVAGQKLSITDLKALKGADSDPGAQLMTMNNGSPIYVRYMADQGALAVSSSPFGPGNTGIPITQNDITAKNGFIHPIGGVLPAPSVAAAAPAPAPAAP